MKSLENNLVVVTGGAGLLGRAFVRAIAEGGAKVVVADINIEGAQKIVAEVNVEFPEAAHGVCLDITSKISVCNLIEELQQRHGKIDAVVNNAYPKNNNYGRMLEDVNYSDFCENLNLHLGGYFLVAQQFCLAFKASGGGNLINMSSVYGSMTPRFSVYQGTIMTMPVEYAAIKSAIEHLTRYFAQYFKGYGIRVNSLSPGGIVDAQPSAFLDAYNSHCASKGMLSGDDIIGALLFLLSEESRYITGQNLIVDDGFSL